jgi:hypothetical protein
MTEGLEYGLRSRNSFVHSLGKEKLLFIQQIFPSVFHVPQITQGSWDTSMNEMFNDSILENNQGQQNWVCGHEGYVSHKCFPECDWGQWLGHCLSEQDESLLHRGSRPEHGRDA